MDSTTGQLRSLEEYRHAVSKSLDFERYSRLAHTMLNAKVGFVTVLDDETQYCLAETNSLGAPVIQESSRANTSICQYTVKQDNKPFVVEDLSIDDRFSSLGCVTGKHQLKSYAGYPVRTAEGINLGSVCVMDHVRTWQPHELVILGDLSRMISNDLDHYFKSQEIILQQRMQKSMTSFVRSNLSPASSLRSEQEGNDKRIAAATIYQNACKVIRRTLDVDGVSICSVNDHEQAGNPLRSIFKRSTCARILATDQGADRRSIVAEAITREVYLDLVQASGAKFRRSERVPRLVLNTFGPDTESLIAVPVHDVEGVAYGLIIAFSDNPHRTFSILEKEYLEAFESVLMLELQRANFKNADHLKSELIKSLSHELRTPLHGLLHNLELLAETHLDAEQKELVKDIGICGNLQLDVVESVLNFSSIRNASRESDAPGSESSIFYPAVDVLNVIEETVAQTIKRHRRRVDVTSDATSPAIIIDSESVNDKTRYRHTNQKCLGGLIEQLVANSLKWTPSGLVRIGIEMSPDAGNDNVYIVVSDTGSGIEPGFLESNAFQTFTKEDSFSPGLGLGLSLVAQYVEQLNGTIDVRSSKGKYTKISVTIPMRHGSDEARADLPSSTFTGKTIGIVLPGIEEQADGLLLKVLERDLHAKHDIKTRRMSALDDFECVDVLFGSSNTVSRLSSGKPSIVWEGRPSEKDGQDMYMGSSYGPNSLSAMLHKLMAKDRPGMTIARSPRKRSYGTAIGMDAAKLSSSELRQLKIRSSPERSLSIGSDRPVDQQDRPSNVLAPEPIVGCAADDVMCVPSPSRSPVPRVLIVEDNATNTRLLERFMTKHNYEYLAATNGLEAVDAFQTTLRPGQVAFDVILMDLQMPIMDGHDATQHIRAIEKEQALRRAYIVACTGLSAESDKAKAARMGFDKFLTKPIALSTLRELFHDWESKQVRCES